MAVKNKKDIFQFCISNKSKIAHILFYLHELSNFQFFFHPKILVYFLQSHEFLVVAIYF